MLGINSNHLTGFDKEKSSTAVHQTGSLQLISCRRSIPESIKPTNNNLTRILIMGSRVESINVSSEDGPRFVVRH